jgi:hypothetical protein
MKRLLMTTATAALALCVTAGTGFAAEKSETVTTTTTTKTYQAPPVVVEPSVTTTTKTYVQQKHLAGTQEVKFDTFDVNHDGVLSMPEVGEKLFYLFDADGNEVIDNIEFDQKRVMTIIPMEKHTLKLIDFDSDGTVEYSTYSYDDFVDVSGLARFDNDMDGLSAAEFIGEPYLALDKDDSKTIELDEWKTAYIKARHPESADQDRYN